MKPELLAGLLVCPEPFELNIYYLQSQLEFLELIAANPLSPRLVKLELLICGVFLMNCLLRIASIPALSTHVVLRDADLTDVATPSAGSCLDLLLELMKRHPNDNMLHINASRLQSAHRTD